MAENVAVVAGSTGLAGRYLVETLAEDGYYDRVVALVRRPGFSARPKVEMRVVDFERLSAADIAGGTHLFCCLGTTLRAAGSREAFRKVDFEYVKRFADEGRRAGGRFLALVSSVGAGTGSGSLYLKTKGEAERAAAEAGFESTHMFRPSLLLGHRDEERPVEEFGKRLFRATEWMLVGGLRKWRPMPAPVLAAAMAAAGERGGEGVQVHHYDAILRLAGGGRPSGSV